MRASIITSELAADPKTPAGSNGVWQPAWRRIQRSIGTYGFALFAPTVALAYSGNTELALIPLLAAALYISSRAGALASLVRLRVFLASLGALVIAAQLSLIVHPSAHAALVDETLLASAALAIALAVDRRSQTFYLTIGTFTVLTVLLWLLTVAANPDVLSQKSPLAALARAPAPLAGAGDLRWSLHPNEVGVLACVTAVCWLGLTILKNERPWRWLSAPMLLLTLAILIDSGSRAGYMAFVAGAMSVLVLRWRFLLWPSVIVVLAGFVLFAVIQTPHPTLPSAPVQSRLVTWVTNLRFILASPWLGRGVASYQALHPTGLSATNGSHNTFLQIWLEFGLLSVLAVASLSVYSLLTALKSFRVDLLGGVMVGVCIAWLMHSMFESTIIAGWHLGSRFEAPWQEVVVPLSFAIWGLAASRAQPPAPNEN
jgi:O-antigen ligase